MGIKGKAQCIQTAIEDTFLCIIFKNMVKITDIFGKGRIFLKDELQGNLIIIGGAEDKKGEKNILKYLCNNINKEDDLILIVTVASKVPHELGSEYKNVFGELGVKRIGTLNINKREDAYDDMNIKLLESADIVFFTGGDQLRITSLLGGTKLYSKIMEKFSEGCIFAGTSAGASVMSDTMIISGEDEESPKKCTLKMAPGFGLIKGAIIDQHFSQRGRIGRILVAVAENPQSLGIGIDEDTAIVVNNKGEINVIGSGAVYIFDGSGISHSNISEQYPDEIFSIYDLKLHILINGDGFNINSKIPICRAYR